MENEPNPTTDLTAILADAARLAALAATGLPDSPAEPSFDRLARLASKFLGVPVSLVSLVDAERQFFKSCIGLPEPWATKRETPLSHSFCQHVVASGEPLVIADARTDPRLKDNLAIPDIGVVAYLGIPLTIGSQVIGSFCAIDGKPRAWTPDDVATMSDLAQSVVSEIRLRADAVERERLLLASEAAKRNVEVTLASIGDAVIATDATGLITFINPVASQLSGWAVNDAIGQPVSDVFKIVEEKNGQVIDQFVDHVLDSGKQAPWRDHTILLARDGGRTEIEESASPIVIDGRIIGAVLTFRDVGPRKQQAKHLADARLRLEYVLEAGAIATWTWDIPSDTLVPDANMARLYSIPPDLVGGCPLEYFTRAIHPDDHERTMAIVNHSLATGEYFEAEYRVIQADGSIRWVVAKSTPTLLPDGSPKSLSGVLVDLTERKVSEEAIKQSERRLRAFVAASSDAVYRMSADWSEMQQLVGQEFIANTEKPSSDWLERYIEPADKDLVQEAIAEAVRSRETFELEHRVRRVDGTVGWTYSRAVPILDEHGEITEWFGTAADVTARKRAEKQIRESEENLRESEARFRMIADNISPLAWTCDSLGNVTWYNRRWLEYTGLSFEEMKGWDWSKVQHPDHLERVVATVTRSAETGEPWEDTFPLRGKDGRYRWFLSHAVPIRDAAGAIICWFGTNTDVTDLREAEHNLRDADRRKDEFLAMLAHELRNPLGAISSGVDLVQRVQKPEVLAELRGMIKHQVKHLTHLIDDLLDVSRITQGKVELRKSTVELSALTRKAAELAQPQIDEKRHELSVSTPSKPVSFVADPTRVEQMLSNLLTNAAKYSEPGRAIDLSAKVEGSEVVFRVRDQGFGISPEMLPKVFGLFTQVDATLDRARGGLGIGLTLVKNLAELHGGSVSATSEGKDKGSEFTLRLPIGQPEALQPQGPAPTPAAPVRCIQTRHRILVIDDNRDTARMTSRLLEHQGYELLTAHDGHEGIEAARAFRPHAILLDIGLPGLNGYEVAETLRNDECCREAIVIAVSGYGETAARERSKEAGIDHHLTKPLDFDQLDTILERLGQLEPSEA